MKIIAKINERLDHITRSAKVPSDENPIIAASNPNGSNFDASLIWGPIMGRNIYFGLRYKIK